MNLLLLQKIVKLKVPITPDLLKQITIETNDIKNKEKMKEKLNAITNRINR